jgi:NADP-dependent aldehyde dehydrogenase
VTHTTVGQTQAIVAASLDAFHQWSAASATTRASCLEAIADSLDAHAETLAELADSETHLGLPRLVGEVARTTYQLRSFATEVRHPTLTSEVLSDPVEGAPPSGRPSLRKIHVPLGPVAVFGAGNFPFAFADLGGDTASALAAGCTVVIKQHHGYPETSTEVLRLARRALESQGMTPDVLTTVVGREAGQALVAHPDIQAVGFTGSLQVGRALWDIAVGRPRPIPFYGELGSANPVFITRAALDARAETIAQEAAASISLGRGQFCTKPSLLVVPDDEDFISQIASELAEVAEGPLLSASSASRFADSVNVVKSRVGVTEVLASRIDVDTDVVSPGLLRVSAEDFVADHDAISTECFGPMAVVITYNSLPQLEQIAEVLEGGLVLTVHAEHPDDTDVVASLYQLGKRLYGRVVTNGWPTGVAVAPAQHHGGPYPASTLAGYTSVGLQAVMRFVRPVTFQGLAGSAWDELV